MSETLLKKKYGFLTAVSMVVGIVIGSGVFFKAQTILDITQGNVSLGIIAWLIGGAIMLCCMLAFSVMAGKYEKVNGVVDYAESTVGNSYGYAVGWFMTFIYYPTLTSALAWLSARYTLTFVQSAFNSSDYISGLNTVSGPEVMVLTLGFLCTSYALNALSPKLAGHFQVSATVIKLIPLVLMAIVGIISGLVSEQSYLISNFTGSAGDESGGLLFSAIVATSFAYEGWIIATSINAELHNSKKNLPRALIAGGIIIIIIYISYYMGVSGGAPVDVLIENGATAAFTNIFGRFFGSVLNAFVAVSCMGTLNGLMLGCTRGMYSIASRGMGMKNKTYSSVDNETNMPANSSILGLLLCSLWFIYFYGANLADKNWFGIFGFDSTELPIVTTYALYIPIFIMFMVKAKDESKIRRFLIPGIAVLGCIAMITAAVFAHGITPFISARNEGTFALPILFYLVIFAVVMIIGIFLMRKKKHS